MKEAARVLRRGGLLAFPTNTVGGLGADVENARAVKRIFEVTGSPSSLRLIVQIVCATRLSDGT